VDLEVVAGGTIQIRIVGKALAPEGYGPPPTPDQVAATAASTIEIRDIGGTLLYSQRGLDSRILAPDRGVPTGEVSVRLTVPGRPAMEQRATVTVGKRSVVTFDVN
jgi:hypothetical protein